MENKKTLSKELENRLEIYPLLKRCVESFIQYEGRNPKPMIIADLTLYIKEIVEIEDLGVPSLFEWDDETTEDFYTWGSNSRYANVLEPLLWKNLEKYVSLLIDWLDENIIYFIKNGKVAQL